MAKTVIACAVLTAASADTIRAYLDARSARIVAERLEAELAELARLAIPAGTRAEVDDARVMHVPPSDTQAPDATALAEAIRAAGVPCEGETLAACAVALASAVGVPVTMKLAHRGSYLRVS